MNVCVCLSWSNIKLQIAFVKTLLTVFLKNFATFQLFCLYSLADVWNISTFLRFKELSLLVSVSISSKSVPNRSSISLCLPIHQEKQQHMDGTPGILASSGSIMNYIIFILKGRHQCLGMRKKCRNLWDQPCDKELCFTKYQKRFTDCRERKLLTVKAIYS